MIETDLVAAGNSADTTTQAPGAPETTVPGPVLIDPDEQEWAARNELVESVVSRTSFELHYARSPEPRSFHISGINGPPIDDAYASPTPATHPGGPTHASRRPPMSIGGWEDDRLLWGELDEERVLATFFSMAVNEAAHEALEWFRIDGRPALDPHGTHESAICDIVTEAAAKLWALRDDHPPYLISERRTG